MQGAVSPEEELRMGVRLYYDWFKHASPPSRYFPPE